MNVLTTEIAKCMSAWELTPQSEVSARFLFPEDFVGFAGHFPGKPVLPGVCMVQAVLVLMQAWQGASFRLEAIVSAKWLAPVGPDVEIRFVCVPHLTQGAAGQVKARIFQSDHRIAELTLRVKRAGALEAAP
jgi:3-hydroxyacyl-[acyl-carrier-protein] dehydratase